MPTPCVTPNLDGSTPGQALSVVAIVVGVLIRLEPVSIIPFETTLQESFPMECRDEFSDKWTYAIWLEGKVEAPDDEDTPPNPTPQLPEEFLGFPAPGGGGGSPRPDEKTPLS
jgi:hypothetical protein